MKLVIHNGADGLNKIEAEWNSLFNRLSTPTYTQSPIWHKSYLQHLATDTQKCFYFCVYKANSLIAIFPLEQAKYKLYPLSLNILGFPRSSHFGLNSVIVDELESTQLVFEFLYQTLKKTPSIKWDVIYLERAIQNSQASLCKINQPKLLIQSINRACDLLPIQPYERTLERFSRNFKGNLRKARKKISTLQNIKYISSNKQTLDTFFEKFIDTEGSGWKGICGEGSAIKLNPQLVKFYRDAMHGFAENGQMEINLLTHNDKTIAAQYAIILAPTVFLLKIGYDEDNRSLSPGNLLIEHKLKEYANNPALTSLNLISDAPWHTYWNPIILSAHDTYNCKSLVIAIYIKSMFWLRRNIKKILIKLGLK